MGISEHVKRLALFALALALGSCIACIHHGIAGPSPRVVRVGYVRTPAVLALAGNWDTASTALERGYCVAVAYRATYPDRRRADSVFVVVEVVPAPSRAAAEDSVVFDCGPGVPTVHTHPWHSPEPSCDPSRADRAMLDFRHMPFAVVQCGPMLFRFYYPGGY